MQQTAVELLLHIGHTHQYLLVAEHQAHVAIDLDVGLLATMDVTTETLVKVDDAIALLLMEATPSIVDAGHILHHTHLGGGVQGTGKGTTVGRPIVIDHDNGHITGCLGVIDQRIKHRIDQTQNQEEDNHALVMKREPYLALPHLEQVIEPAHNRIVTTNSHGT